MSQTRLPSSAATGHDPVRAFFDTHSYLDRNAIIPVRAQIVAEMLRHVSDGYVLDLGCGDGSISRPLLAARNRLTLVDFSPGMLERARAQTDPGAPVAFVQADILDFSPGRAYDAVLCVGVLAHVASVDQAIARVSSALRIGGLGVLQTTDDGAPLGRLLNLYYRRRRKQEYAFARMSLGTLVACAARHALVCRQVKRYGLLWPGLGRMPYRWESAIERFVASSPRVSRLGAEAMICFERV